MKDAIRECFIETMPTAAYHSGLAAHPGHQAWVGQITSQHGKPAYRGLGALVAWLTANGISHTRSQARTLHHHYLCEEMRSVSCQL